MPGSIIVRRNYDIKLTMEEEIEVIRKYAIKHADVVKIILAYPNGCCPFPDKCNYFPCDTLDCDNDCLNNGYPYQWS